MGRTGVKVPRRVCVKVASLRPRYKNLQDWLETPKHVLVTRRGRVFLEKTTVFHYPQSEWHNPFPVGPKEKGKYSLDESLSLFRAHLDQLLADPATRTRFEETMAGADEMGCFCAPGAQCHADVLISAYSDLKEL